uniref:BACK domain-containing protein n=1 Tax=Ciona savignyi TaxID=51511 RepID=H2YZ31_CIOSA
MLQIKYVKDYCVGFLKDTLEVGNCLIVRAFAQMYNISELVTHCDNFFLDNFELVLNGPDFKELNPDETEALIRMAKTSDSSSEEMIFRSIMNWVKHDLENRQQFFKRFFQLIDIKKLPTSFLKVIKKTEWTWM